MSPPFDLFPIIFKGAGVTVELTVCGAFFALLIAFIAGFGRLSKLAVVRGFTMAYVEFFRGTSLLVQLFWFFYVLPLFGVELPAMVVGVMALAINYGAYASEVVRSSILAVPKGQTEAAIALNMTPWQRMRRVILPQALAMMMPGFGNLLIELLKGTALVSLIFLGDMTYQAMNMRQFSPSRALEIFSVLLIFYFVIAYAFTLGMRWLERKLSAGRL